MHGIYDLGGVLLNYPCIGIMLDDDIHLSLVIDNCSIWSRLLFMIYRPVHDLLGVCYIIRLLRFGTLKTCRDICNSETCKGHIMTARQWYCGK